MELYVSIRVPPSLRKRGATTKRSRMVDPHLAVGKSAKHEQLLANRNQVPVSIRKVPGEGWQPEPGQKEASPAVGCPPRRPDLCPSPGFVVLVLIPLCELPKYLSFQKNLKELSHSYFFLI